MNTSQLLHCVKQDHTLSKYFIGVFACDTIPKTSTGCYIFNTDPIAKPGTHWQARFTETDGAVEQFDSYGRPSQTDSYNLKRIQGPLSSSCGQYCLYYLCHKARGRRMKEIVNDFSTDYVLNDLCVTEFINRNFNLNTETYNLLHVMSQICKPEC